MTRFDTQRLPIEITEVAPDGSNVRLLLGVAGGVMAHYELAPGKISVALRNQTVEEIWYFISGRGEMWRQQGDREEVVTVESGVCITIPLGTHFQFRTRGEEPLLAIGVVMPPWPGASEAIVVEGKWKPTAN